ncbi:MAG: hypothetical protein ACRC8S_07690 [Fimbriiglobus sp.]
MNAIILSDGQDATLQAALQSAGWTVRNVGQASEDWLLPAAEDALVGMFTDTRQALFGLGTGGHAALRFGFRYHAICPIVVVLNAVVDLHDCYGLGTVLDEYYPSREACRQASALLQIRPFQVPTHLYHACEPGHPAHRGNDRLHEKLRALGIAHTFDEALHPEARVIESANAAWQKLARKLL